MTSLSIVIPAYNEENGIADIVQRVLAVLPRLRDIGIGQFELLVVDDGSADTTAQITQDLAGLSPNLRLIRHPKNRGYGAALKTGFAAATGDLIGFLDADGTYPPEYFPSLCQSAMGGADLVVGSRMAGAKSEMPLTRRIGNRFFAGLLSLLGGASISDSASGMRIFRREVLGKLSPLPDGLNLTPVMSARAIHEHIKMSEVAIPYSERVGRSKLSVLHDGSISLQSILWTILSYNPVRIFGSLGLIAMGISLLCGLWIVVERLSGVTTLGTWGVSSVIIGAISAMASVNLLSLGIMFNYLVVLFHDQPIKQGLFGRPLFSRPLDIHFWWLGLLGMGIGAIIGTVSVALALQGWTMERLWLYGMGSMMLIVIGGQLLVFWIILQILKELQHRR